MLPYTKLLTLVVSLTFALSLGLASTASAKVIKGTPKNDVLVGTNKADRIDGKAGNDKISGKAGNDVIIGGKGKDKINAGTGNDTIKVKDGKVDTVSCGPGTDKVTSDKTDKLAADCEVPPATGNTPTPTPTPTAAITVVVTGAGSVTSAPAGINCGLICAGAFNVGTVVTLTATPDAGETFVGWGGACSGTGTCTVTADSPKGVTAAFVTRHDVTVSIAGTGSGSVESSTAGIVCPSDCNESVDQGSSIILTASANSSSTFTGWSGGGCSGTAPCIVTPSAATAVTATFTLKSYVLTVSKAGTGAGAVTSTPSGINCGATCDQSFDHGTVVTLTAAASVGSSFTGWSGGGCSGTGTCVVTMADVASVTATFTLNSYTLTAGKAGTGTGTVTSAPSGISCGVDCSEAYNHGTSVTLTASAGVDSTFTGWVGGGCSGTGTCVVSVTAATSVTATFTLNSYALTQSLAGNGTGTVTSAPAGINCGVDCTESYNSGTVVSLSAAAGVGSTFTGWSGGGCSGVGSCNVTMSAATSVTATFTLNSYTLTQVRTGTGTGTVTSVPSGIACGVDCTEVFNHGTTVTLTASAAPGSTFTGWSGGGCTGVGTCTVTLTSATTVTAQFSITTYTLTTAVAGDGGGTVTSSPSGINCGGDCSEAYPNGSLVTLTPTALLGSAFTGWTGACSGSGSCNVTMSAAASVTATFTMIFFQVGVTTSGTGTGTVTSSPSGINCGADCSETYLPGTTAVLTATPTGGSTFAGWSGGGCSGTGTCSVSNTATVDAQFNAP